MSTATSGTATPCKRGNTTSTVTGIPELVLVAGDDVIDLVVNILKYKPSSKRGHVPQSLDWQLLGSFSGQRHVDIEKNTITLPYGSQGLFDEYRLIKGKFVKSP